MSPRHNRRREDPGPSPDEIGAGVRRVEEWADGDWMVRAVTGTAAAKTYRCPGCDQQIPAGTPHLVTWPVDLAGDSGLAYRRHWHRPCWQARDRRRANVQRSRNAPRYG